MAGVSCRSYLAEVRGHSGHGQLVWDQSVSLVIILAKIRWSGSHSDQVSQTGSLAAHVAWLRVDRKKPRSWPSQAYPRAKGETSGTAICYL